MEARLYVVHGSHPCATVAKALELKGVPYRTVELPPPMRAAIQRLRFGSRTVPALRFDGEKLTGSRAILRRLEELRPDPPLQPIARRLLWPAIKRNPACSPRPTGTCPRARSLSEASLAVLRTAASRGSGRAAWR